MEKERQVILGQAKLEETDTSNIRKYLFTGYTGSSLLHEFFSSYSLIAVHGLLIAVASLVAEHRL